jgi:curved DNA-binding protein CbpA
MSTRDLYCVLGVARDATQLEIRDAYRRRAKIAHPDSGGSPEAFNELNSAYEILSDPNRRDRYDRTGEIEPVLPDNLDASAVEVLASKLGLLIHAEEDLTSMDIFLVIEDAIRADIVQAESNISRQRRAIERLTRIRDRIRHRAEGENNRLAPVLAWHELSSKGQIRKGEEALRSMERALEILRDYWLDDALPEVGTSELSAALQNVLHALKQAEQIQVNQFG